jgi:hypothetical protein
MAMPKAERRSARVQVVPLVQHISDLDCRVLALVAVRVSDKRGLPVVMEVRVADGHCVAAVRDVEETVVVVLVMVEVGRKINVVDPDAVRGLDAESVTSVGEYNADL